MNTIFLIFFTGCNLGDERTERISEALKTNTSLTKLFVGSTEIQFNMFLCNITDNKIGIEGVKAIGEALKTNKSLTQLNIKVIET